MKQTKTMKQTKPLKKSNSFVIVIKDTQNGSWQGTIDWVEGKKVESFRSALEMIKLIDSVVEQE